MNVVCVGDCGVDHYLPSGEQFFGGITANFARHAKRMFAADDRISIISCTGNDDAAKLVMDGLEASGLEAHLQRLEGATPVQYIEVLPGGEKHFVRYDEGVLNDLRFGDEERELVRTADLLVAPVYLQIVDLFDTLLSTSTSATICIDFADFLQHPDFSLLDRHIDSIDIGFFGLSSDDPSSVEQLAKRAARHGKLFVVTLGPDGSIAFQGDKTFRCDAVPVDKVVDTTGAGDAFAAAFLAQYCHGAPIGDALSAGASLAAEVIAHRGAVNA